MRESEITKAVMQHWKKLGVPGSLVAGIPNAMSQGQYGLTKGLPDLIVMAPDLPIGFIELKTDKGKASEAQLAFKALCLKLGIPFALTFGRDEPIKVLEEWRVVRKATP